ncbi:GNAT family N-acetyltransferase [bacterium]|nr:GNAT family N-acetyltransferase [bacterium]
MFRIVTSQDDLLKVYSVRSIVFIEEQNCSYNIEVDGMDFTAMHILGVKDDEPFAAGRIRFLGEYVKFERLAIRKAYRGQGHGNQLLQFAMNAAREKGYSKYKLHAQVHALKFYEKHGFKAKGDVFLEADIEHQLMMRE